MSGKDQSKQKRLAMQLIVGGLLAALFVGLGAWGVIDIGNRPYGWLFLAGLTCFAVLYIVAIMLMIGQYFGTNTDSQTASDESWVNRTMNLNELSPVMGASVEYEITFIHSNFVVM